MKTIHITTWLTIALLSIGSASAQGNQGRRIAGYGGPPKTDTERAARQEECQQANGGVCDGQGRGQGKSQGKGQRRGQCRGGADCPSGN